MRTAIGLVLLVFAARSGPAADFNIGPGDAASLQKALTVAAATPEADTITLAAGSTYSITTAVEGNQALPSITTPITIVGNGATIERATSFVGDMRILRIAGPFGDVTLRNVTIRGGRLSSGAAGAGALSVGLGLTIEDSTFTDNRCDDAAQLGQGGAVYMDAPLTIRNSTLSQNHANKGGAIANPFGRTLTIERSHIVDNVAAGLGASGGGVGGAIATTFGEIAMTDSTVAGNQALAPPTGNALGGGIANEDGNWTITRSTVSGNSATSTAPSTGNALGGGMYSTGGGTITLVNSTVSGNRVLMAGAARVDGGGVAAEGAGSWTLRNVTIAGNNLPAAPANRHGGGIFVSGPTFHVQNSIIGDNVADAGPDCFTTVGSTIVSGGYTLFESTAGCAIATGTGDVTGQDAFLGPLADNGGLTLTHALGAASPAENAGNPENPGQDADACETVDQRCFGRPAGGRCDMGAVEQGAIAVCADVTTTTTTTTLPAGCGLSAATFASILCRLDELIADVQGTAALGKQQAKLLQSAQSGRDKTTDAQSLSSAGKAKPAKKKLKKAARAVTSFVHRLSSRSARKSIPTETRQPLLDAAAPIAADLKTLSQSL